VTLELDNVGRRPEKQNMFVMIHHKGPINALISDMVVLMLILFISVPGHPRGAVGGTAACVIVGVHTIMDRLLIAAFLRGQRLFTPGMVKLLVAVLEPEHVIRQAAQYIFVMIQQTVLLSAVILGMVAPEIFPNLSNVPGNKFFFTNTSPVFLNGTQ
jgi:hypothetical protein